MGAHDLLTELRAVYVFSETRTARGQKSCELSHTRRRRRAHHLRRPFLQDTPRYPPPTYRYLSLLLSDPQYTQNELRQDLWRAGHAHAGVWLVLSLVALRYVDEATLSEGMRWVVCLALPAAAILMPLGFFLSVLSHEATEPNALIGLTYVAGVVLAVGLLVLGVGLVRGRRTERVPA